MSADVVAPLETAMSAEETKQKIDQPSDEISVAMTIMSPFVTTSKEFQWPSIYEEIDEMLEACILTYPVADLRALARENKLKNDCVSKLPLSSVQCVDAIAGNLDAFKKPEPTKPEAEAKSEATPTDEKATDTHAADAAVTADPDDASAIAISASRFCPPAPPTPKEEEPDKSADESFVVRLDALKALHARQLKAKSEGRPFAVSHSNYIAFSDDSTKDEMAYAVSVDKNRQRVTICFRGSASDTKWATSETWMKTFRNPGEYRYHFFSIYL